MPFPYTFPFDFEEISPYQMTLKTVDKAISVKKQPDMPALSGKTITLTLKAKGDIWRP